MKLIVVVSGGVVIATDVEDENENSVAYEEHILDFDNIRDGDEPCCEKHRKEYE